MKSNHTHEQRDSSPSRSVVKGELAIGSTEPRVSQVNLCSVEEVIRTVI